MHWPPEYLGMSVDKKPVLVVPNVRCPYFAQFGLDDFAIT